MTTKTFLSPAANTRRQMNKVQLTGILTKEPYKSPKGWVGATLACPKQGTDFKEWINLYIPAGDAAKAFSGAQRNELFHVEGEWDSKKNQEGTRESQVKVFSASRVTQTKNVHNLEVTDEDIPF